MRGRGGSCGALAGRIIDARLTLPESETAPAEATASAGTSDRPRHGNVSVSPMRLWSDTEGAFGGRLCISAMSTGLAD